MKASNYVKYLQELIEKYGDFPIIEIADNHMPLDYPSYHETKHLPTVGIYDFDSSGGILSYEPIKTESDIENINAICINR